jgi:cephalosporin hydroxylase
MNDHDTFKAQGAAEITKQGADADLRQKSIDWLVAADKHKYSYHFEWLGRPIIQHPQDMIGTQELLWNIQPDLIIETGIVAAAR